MKKLKLIFMILIVVTFFISLACTSRVIKQTETTAIIQGMGMTKIEAKIEARKKAKTIFMDFEETKEPECSQEYSVRGRGDADSYSASGSTHWSCVIFIKKK